MRGACSLPRSSARLRCPAPCSSAARPTWTAASNAAARACESCPRAGQEGISRSAQAQARTGVGSLSAARGACSPLTVMEARCARGAVRGADRDGREECGVVKVVSEQERVDSRALPLQRPPRQRREPVRTRLALARDGGGGGGGGGARRREVGARRARRGVGEVSRVPPETGVAAYHCTCESWELTVLDRARLGARRRPGDPRGHGDATAARAGCQPARALSTAGLSGSSRSAASKKRSAGASSMSSLPPAPRSSAVRQPRPNWYPHPAGNALAGCSGGACARRPGRSARRRRRGRGAAPRVAQPAASDRVGPCGTVSGSGERAGVRPSGTQTPGESALSPGSAPALQGRTRCEQRARGAGGAGRGGVPWSTRSRAGCCRRRRPARDVSS